MKKKISFSSKVNNISLIDSILIRTRMNLDNYRQKMRESSVGQNISNNLNSMLEEMSESRQGVSSEQSSFSGLVDDRDGSNQSHSQDLQIINPEPATRNVQRKRIRKSRAQINKIKSYVSQLTNQSDAAHIKIFWAQFFKMNWISKSWVNRQLQISKKQWKQTRIEEQVTNAVSKFILQHQSNIKIYVEPNSLKLRILTDDYTHCQSVFHVYDLQHSMLRFISTYAQDPKELQPQNVQKKIQQLFQGLFKCLKHFLIKNVYNPDRKRLNSLDFLYFPLSKQKRQQSHKPIFIGGLKYVCLKYFRILIRMVLEHKIWIQTEIQKNLNHMKEQQKQTPTLQQCMKCVMKKISLMKQTDQKEENQIRRQMSRNFFKETINNFHQQVKNLSSNCLYRSFKSFKIHFMQQTFYIVNGNEDVEANVRGQELKLKNVKLSGRLVSRKTSSKGKKISLDLIRDKNYFSDNIGNEQEMEKEKSLKIKSFFAFDKKDKAWLILYQSGEFHLITPSETMIKKYKKILQDLYGCKTRQYRYEHCYEGKFDMSEEAAEKLFNDPPQGLKPQMISRLRQQAEKIIINRKNHMIKTRMALEQRQADSEEIIINQFESYIRLNYATEKMVGQSSKFLQETVFLITKKGFFRVNGSQQVIKSIQNNNRIAASPCLQTKISSLSKNISYEPMQLIGDNGYITNTLRRMIPQDISWSYRRDDFTISELLRQKEGRVNLRRCQQNFPVDRLKILIWNIQGEKYESKNRDKNRNVTDELIRWKEQRFQTMAQQILKKDPDFICLQQVHDQKDVLFNKFMNKLGKHYYYSKISTNHRNIEPEYFSRRRTVILSKIPVKFYEISFNKCITSKNQGANFLTMCEFEIKIRGKELPTLLVSIHLKAHQSPQNSKLRQGQLNILQKICSTFPIVILAGDFNIGECFLYPQNNHSFLKQFKDLDDFFLLDKKPYTHFKLDSRDFQRYDRILIRIKDEKLHKKLFGRPEEFGNFSCLPYQDHYFKQSEGDNQERGLSDHYGRCTQVMLKK